MPTLPASMPAAPRAVYLIDTNVISEARKGRSADAGVIDFFVQAEQAHWPLYLSAVTIGELRRGIELIRFRGDRAQARRLETWLNTVVGDYARHILPFDIEAVQVWGLLRAPDPSRELDKQIAAIALVHDLTVVTGNTSDFEDTPVRVLNPFKPKPSTPPRSRDR